MYDEEKITVSVTNTLTAVAAQDKEQIVVDQNPKATLYPNPAVDKIFITLQSQEEKVVVRIIDMTGSVVSTNTYTLSGKTRIETDVTKLSRGISLAEIETSQGKQSLKFIKK